MSEAEVILVNEAKNCTFYTIQFLSELPCRTLTN